MLIDTHCHIHDSEFAEKSDQTVDQILAEASEAEVSQLVCVGTSERSSKEAVVFCGKYSQCYASLALHPHEVEAYSDSELAEQMNTLESLADNKNVVAIGETGLDYYYHSDESIRERQKNVLKLHLELADKHNLPLIFHIRDPKDDSDGLGLAFADFFKVFDSFKNVRGVVHSFTATQTELTGVIERGLFIGLNGIMTFTKDQKQLEAAKSVPLKQLVLETDAPFLTPAPFRGKICKPKHVRVTAEFLSELRGESFDELAAQTTKNAKKLFTI